MKPDPSETAAHLRRLRQQLLLAEVRRMELEDARDDLAATLSGAEQLRAAAQSLADQKIDEAGHLAKIQADLTAQLQHQRHLQHVAHEALEAARKQLTDLIARVAELTGQLDASADRVAAAERRHAQLQQEIVELADQILQSSQTIHRLGLDLAETAATAAARQARIETLDAELRAMKASRSWRWTRWLRSLQRTFAPRKA